MKRISRAALLAGCLSAAVASAAFTSAAFAQGRPADPGRPANPGRPAPGPIAGAGLPFLLAAGAAGAYGLIRRRRNESRRQHGETEQG